MDEDDSHRLVAETIASAALVVFCPWLIAIDLALVANERLLMLAQELLAWPQALCNEQSRRSLEIEEQ